MVEVILRNRHGRKRKSGRRHPNGRLVAEKGIDRLTLASRMPHRGTVPQDLLLDARSECELGRMCLLGRISEAQYEAGRIFVGLLGRYLQVLQGPKGLSSKEGGFDCRGANPCEDCECAKRREQYHLAYEALRQAGHYAVTAVWRVAIEDEPLPASWNFNPLLWGLSALKVHFGIGPPQPGRTQVLAASY